MPTTLPHNAKIRNDVASYLSEVRDVVHDCVANVEASGDYRNIYKSCLACDSVLSKLSVQRQSPRLSVARGLIQRVPLLTAVGQMPASHNELRRFVEVVLWCIYFTDHPIEWKSFSSEPSRGFVRDISTPIQFCAFRERSFYSNYAEEFFKSETSGVALDAARELSRLCGELNAEVHASHVAASAVLRPAWDSPTSAELNAFAKKHRGICANACIVLAAHQRRRFEKLPPAHRDWFDWLVGSTLSKKIRSGPFGL